MRAAWFPLQSMVAAAALCAAALVPARTGAAPDVSVLDLIELEIGYSSLSENYYRNVDPQVLLDGARTGIVAYLRGQGIAEPRVGFMHARADGRGAVPAIEQQVGKAIERYGARVDVRELVYETIRGEVAALRDPYTVFFTKSEVHRFSTALDGETFGGVGIAIANDARAGVWRIDRVFAGGPAARAGLAPGDVLTAVDGTPVDGLPTATLTKLLRGKIGSVVRVGIVRAGVALDAPVPIVRGSVTPPEVNMRLLPDGIGYIALHVFGPHAGSDVRSAVNGLVAQGARGVVFDLRGNGGGYESAAVRVASTFIARGPVVATQENRGKRHVTNADGSAVAAGPLIVLVDHDSASGAELVAAAIQDRGVGRLVGTRTYGKGLVQTMFPLPDGSAMKVTTARYFTPGGRDIDRIGVVPDVTVDEGAGAQLGVPGADPQLDRALTMLRLEPSLSRAR